MTGLNTILYAADLSEASDRAFAHARCLAERFGAHLTLYHAVELDRGRRARPGVSDAEAETAAGDAARAHLGALAQRLSSPHEILVETGLAVPALADLAVLGQIARLQPDLTVMATHSRQNAGSYFVGSVTERVVREAHRAVLVVPRDAAPLTAPYRRILVTTDLSPASARAFPWSRRLARELAAELVALHVAARAPVDTTEALAQAETLRRFVGPGHSGVDVRPLVAYGTAWREIVAAADRHEADLIVMSTRGHDSLADEVLGSHADRVMRFARRPVCVVG